MPRPCGRRWLVGSEVTLVSAQFGEFGSDPPQQTAFVIYRFANNALALRQFARCVGLFLGRFGEANRVLGSRAEPFMHLGVAIGEGE